MHQAPESAAARTTFAPWMLSPCSWQLMQCFCTCQVSQLFLVEQAACQKVSPKHSCIIPTLLFIIS